MKAINHLRPKAYSYLRFSTPEQAQGDSTRRQRQMAETYAANHDLDLDETLSFRDLGKSAYRGSNADDGRLGDFLRLLEEDVIPKGSFLLVENLDRISRDVVRKAVRTLEDIVEKGITLVTLSDNRRYDLEILDKDPTAFLIMVLGFQRAHEESQIKSARLRAVWKNKRENASKGNLLTSRVPAWLKVESGEIHPIQERVDLVNWMFNERKGGRGTELIARHLNNQKEPTWGRSAYWHTSYIKKILSNPAVIGTLIPHEVITDPESKTAKKTRRVPLDPILNYYPAIIPMDLWNEVAGAPTTQIRQVGNNKPKTVLAGLACCPICEGRMHRVNKGSRSRPSLVCGRAKSKAGCKYKSVRIDQLEPFLLSNILPSVLSSPPSSDQNLQEKIVQNQNNLEAIEDSIQTIVENLRTSQSPALLDQLGVLEAEKQDLIKLIRDQEAQRDNEFGPVINQRIDKALDLIKQGEKSIQNINLALRSLFKKIIIDYNTGYLRFVWLSGGETEEFHTWPQE
ncbi:recombinase family protein [Akkermansiaceae bacterium]|nr:recombinase family protein [Akkermansiaceae bacterium]